MLEKRECKVTFCDGTEQILMGASDVSHREGVLSITKDSFTVSWPLQVITKWETKWETHHA